MSTSRDSRIGLPLSSDSSTASSRPRSWIAARDAEQVLAALGAAHRRPRTVERAAGGADRVVDVGRAGLGDLGQRLLVGRVDRLDRLARAVAERAVDEDLVARLEPRDVARLGRGCVLEGAHGSVHRHVVGAVVGAGRQLVPLLQQVVEQAGRAEPEQPRGRASPRRRPRSPSRGSARPPWSCGCRRRASRRAARRCASRKSRTASSMTSATGGVRRGRHLAGRGLDEVAAGEQRQPGRAPHVVERRELAGLEDDLEVRVAARLPWSRRSRRRPAGSARPGTRRGRSPCRSRWRRRRPRRGRRAAWSPAPPVPTGTPSPPTRSRPTSRAARRRRSRRGRGRRTPRRRTGTRGRTGRGGSPWRTASAPCPGCPRPRAWSGRPSRSRCRSPTPWPWS